MFEREVIIGTLKHQTEELKKLVGLMEETPRYGRQDAEFYHETLKKIETAIKRVRNMDGDEGIASRPRYFSSTLRVWDIS